MRVTWIVGAGFAILLAAACGGIGTSSGGGGFSGVGPDAGHGHGGTPWVSVGDAGGDARSAVLSAEGGAPAPPWTPPDAGPVPVVACGAGLIDSGGADAETSDAAAPDASPGAAAEGGALCALPAPHCLGGWLVSYSGGSCQNGLCVFTQHVINCSGGCDNGLCYPQIPASE